MIFNLARKSAYLFTLVMVLAPFASAQTGEVSFTPTGFKFPIMKITIAQNTGSAGTAISATHEQVIYKCASDTASDCLVDLSNQTELDAISAKASGVSVEVGTYDLLSLSSCADGSSGSDTVSVWLKGAFTASSTAYYTNAASTSGITSSGSTAEFTEISNWGCSTKAIILANPLIVGDPGTVASPTPGASPSPTPTVSLTQTLTVLVDNTYLASSTPNTSPGAGGCKAVSGGGSRGICVNIPVLLPYVGTDTTTTKRFLLAHRSTVIASGDTSDDSKANAIVIVPMAGTTPLTVFGGRYYSETSAAASNNTPPPVDSVNGGPTYVTSTDISSFKVNADGSVAFKQGGSADTYAGIFGAFQLSDHVGSATTGSGATWYYHAIQF